MRTPRRNHLGVSHSHPEAREPARADTMEGQIQAQIPGLDHVISEYSVVCLDPIRSHLFLPADFR